MVDESGAQAVAQRLHLRPMTLDDVDAVAALDRRAFGDACWSRAHFAGEVADSPISIFYVLRDEAGALLGYFGTWHVVDQLHLCTFAIDPDRQGQGLGTVLLACVLRLAQRLDCEELQLEVRESNAVARELYRSRGFVEQGIRRNLYSHPREDGVLMSLQGAEQMAAAWHRARTSSWSGAIELHWDDRGGQLPEHWQFSPASAIQSDA